MNNKLPILQVREIMKYLFCAVMFLLSANLVSAVEPNSPAHLKNVKFRIVKDQTLEPIRNREFNICRFAEFKLKPGASSPYLKKDSDFFITSVTTDDNGIFKLDLSQINAMDIVVIETSEPHGMTRFERSSDLAHKKSADHIRIVEFKPGSTEVANNMIYDLKNKMVAKINSPECSLVYPYEEIILVAKGNHH